MSSIDPADLDLPKLIKDLIQLGIFGCSSGFTASAYELFEHMHVSFPDSEAPVVAMVYAKLMDAKIKESDDLLAAKKEPFDDESDAIVMMQMFIEAFRNHGVEAMRIMQDMQNTGDELTKRTIERMLRTLGRSAQS